MRALSLSVCSFSIIINFISKRSVCTAYPLSVAIDDGQKSCFYEVVPSDADGKRRVEVFVLEGEDLSIWLSVKGPFEQGRLGHPSTSGPAAIEMEQMITAQEVMENDPSRFGENYIYEFRATAGIYEICLDNSSHSLLSPGRKVVELEVTSPYFDSDDSELALIEQESETIAKAAAASKDAPASEDDLSALAFRLLKLRSELDVMDKKQARERRRLAVHSQSEEKAKAGMIAGSIIETAMFIGTCVFQLLFISRWFKGKKVGSSRSRGGNHWA